LPDPHDADCFYGLGPEEQIQRSTIEDRLVQLALAGPIFEKGEHQTKIKVMPRLRPGGR